MRPIQFGLALALGMAAAATAHPEDFKGIFHDVELEQIRLNTYITDIKSNGARRVGINLVWREWEPNPEAGGGPTFAPCSPGLIEFEGRCFRIPYHIDAAIKRYSGVLTADPSKVILTAVLFGSPEWANSRRRAAAAIASTFPTPCALPAFAGGAPNPQWVHCVPDEERIGDYGLWVAMIAQRYNGLSGEGRIDEFLVWNEVNQRGLFGFDVGVTPPEYTGRLERYWLDTHNCLFGKAYDQIRRFNATAVIRVYPDHYFGFGDFKNQPEKLGGFKVIDDLARYGGERACFAEPSSVGPDRDWQVAVHPYSVDVGSTVFDPIDDFRIESNDWRFITFATLGRLTGWLRKNFPIHARDVLVSEAGFSSLLSGEEEQAFATCRSYREALATPGISGYLTYRYRDTVLPCEGRDDCLGLKYRDGAPKVGWHTWSSMDRAWPYGCGFEVRVPSGDVGVLLKRYAIGNGHQVTTRLPLRFPPAPEMSWLLLRDNRGQEAVTKEIFECFKEGDAGNGRHFLSENPSCSGFTNMGSVGFTYTSADAVPGLGEIVQCVSPADDYTVVPRRTGCPAGFGQGSLGWVFRSANDVAGVEGTGANRELEFTVSLVSAFYQPIVLAYSTQDGTAQAGSDYVATSGLLMFPPGTTTQKVKVAVVADSVQEPNETFFLDIAGPANAVITGSYGVGTIVDDDSGLTIDDRVVAEGSATNAAFRVSLGSPSAQPVTVDYATADGTAVAGDDYLTTSGTLTFPAGRTVHTIIVPIVTDGTPEGNEVFTVQLSNPSGATIARGQATGTISDPPPAAKVAMYRAYNPGTDYHFFTTSLSSKEFVVSVLGFRDESNPVPFYVWNTRQPDSVPLFRMYNPNLGRHFYTAGTADRDFLLGVGMIYETDEGFIYGTPAPGTTELFKLYNNNSGTHLFTADAAQKDNILTLFPGVWVQHTSVGYVFATP